MITNPIGKLYVGSTIDFDRRIRAYKSYRCKDQPKIYNSLKKYGQENHVFEIVWSGDIEEMYKYETLIGWGFNVLEPYNLNLTLPKFGEIYSCVSVETRNKIGLFHKGKILSQETKNKIKESKQNITIETKTKMSFSAKNKIISSETKEKMRIVSLNRKYTPETRLKMSQWQIGKKHSQETKDKIRTKRLGDKWDQIRIDNFIKIRNKPIIQFTLTEDFIKEWESAKIAGLCLNIDSSSILKCCKNKLKTSGNFKWKYKK